MSRPNRNNEVQEDRFTPPHFPDFEEKKPSPPPPSSSSPPSAPHGQSHSSRIVAKPKFLKDSTFVESLTSNVTSTMSGWLSYLPTTVSKNLPAVIEESSRPKVLWCSFQHAKIRRVDEQANAPEQGTNLYLVLGYADGFQIWDCSNIEEIHEVLSIKEGATRSAKFLEPPMDEQTDQMNGDGKQELYQRFDATRPHFAAITSDSAQKVAWSNVKIFSLKNGEVVHVLRFKSEVFNIYSNSRVLIVCLHDHLFAFDARTYKSAFSISGCQPSPHSGSSVVALGVRWLAYSTSQPVSRNHKTSFTAEQGASLATHPMVDAAKGVAVDLAQNLYHWGDKGFQAMSNYFAGTSDEKTNPTSRSPPKKAGEAPKGAAEASETSHGTVMIRDVTTRSAIAHFQAHTTSISCMAFNPNGSLLVTASSQGHDFSVFQILPNITGDSSKPSHRLLYKLKRGVFTNAIIEDISFSNNSQWVNVSSARGTTHIFPINPFGGAPTVYTHTRERFESPPFTQLQAIQNQQNAEGHISIPALGRIKQPSPLAQEEGTAAAASASLAAFSKSRKVPIASFFVSRIDPSLASGEDAENRVNMGLFVVNSYGILSFFILCPEVLRIQNKQKENQEEKELRLRVEQLIEWSLARGDNYSPCFSPFERVPDLIKNKKGKATSKWLSNVEITTHAVVEKPIWMGPQFVFKTFQPSQAGHEGEAEAIISSSNFEDEEFRFDDDLPSRSIEFRRETPIPYGKGSYDADETLVSSFSPNELMDALESDHHFESLSSSLPKRKEKEKDHRRGSLPSKDTELDFDDAFVISSTPNSFKEEWEWDGAGSGRTHDAFENGDYESFTKETIGSPDGDNELDAPGDSVLLH